MTINSGFDRFDEGAAGRDAGDERLADDDVRGQLGEDAGDGAFEEDQERQAARDKLDEAF
jgi:hypothetical protein